MRRPSLPTALTLLAVCCAIGCSANPASAAIRLSRLSLKRVPQHNETLGTPKAPVKLVYFGDPQSPITHEWHEGVLPSLVGRYVRTGKLQIQWQGIEVIGPASLVGERFIEAAGLQNHLWDVLDDVMTNQGELHSGWLTPSLLDEVGASIPKFNVAAAASAAYSPPITGELVAALRRANQRGIVGVPAFLLGHRGGPLRGFEFSGFEPPEWERGIDRLLPKRHR